MSSDDDADLKLAMEMSLQQSSPAALARQPATRETINLASDTDDKDEDLQLAIELSKQESDRSGTAPPVSAGRESNGRIDPTSAVAQHRTAAAAALPSETVDTDTPRGILGLDRQAMERERIARASAKRKRELSPGRPVKQRASSPPQSKHRPSQATVTQLLRYPRGTIKRTFATKYPRTDDITIDEVLEADSINIAVISSFMWNAEWLHEKLPPQKVKQVWIMNVKEHSVQERYRNDVKNSEVPNLKIHFPPMDGMIQSMHSKFMLLFGKEKLRFVIPTANMTQIDWGEVPNDWQPAVMENSVFLIDLPRRRDGEVGSRTSLSSFGTELIKFLEKQKLDRKIIDGILKFDFEATSQLAFIHSVAGSHKSNEVDPTGLPGLAAAVRILQVNDVSNLQLDYAASSLGAINNSFLHRMHLAACGRDFTAGNENPADTRSRTRIYFPTQETVEQSIGGPECGGIISVARHHYSAATFPRECLREYDSTRRGMLSHNKLLFARGRKQDGTPIAWVYVGSSNISESAWGGQKVLKSGQMGSLNIRNWECGVLMPVSSEKLQSMGDNGEIPMSVFEGTVEIPFHYPGKVYGTKHAWFRSG